MVSMNSELIAQVRTLNCFLVIQESVGDWGDSLAGRELTSNPWSTGFNPQPHLNKTWWCKPLIQHIGGWKQKKSEVQGYPWPYTNSYPCAGIYCLYHGGRIQALQRFCGLSIPPGISHYLYKSHISGSSLARTSFYSFDSSGPWIKSIPYKAPGSMKKNVLMPTHLN